MANKELIPESRESLNSLKTEIASQLGVGLQQGYNGNLTAKDAGSIGGEMVRRMINYSKNNLS